MAKDRTGAALVTPDLLPMPKRRGRPSTGKALTVSERQKRFREKRVPVVVGSRMSATVAELAALYNLTADQVTAHLIRFALCNKNWKKTGFPE